MWGLRILDCNSAGKTWFFEPPAGDSIEGVIFATAKRITCLQDKKIELTIPSPQHDFPYETGIPLFEKEVLAGTTKEKGIYRVLMAVSPQGIRDHPSYYFDQRFPMWLTMDYRTLFSYILLHELGHIHYGDLEERAKPGISRLLDRYLPNISYQLTVHKQEMKAEWFVNKHLGTLVKKIPLT